MGTGSFRHFADVQHADLPAPDLSFASKNRRSHCFAQFVHLSTRKGLPGVVQRLAVDVDQLNLMVTDLTNLKPDGSPDLQIKLHGKPPRNLCPRMPALLEETCRSCCGANVKVLV